MPNPFERLREKVVYGQAVKIVAKGVQRENLAERRAEPVPTTREEAAELMRVRAAKRQVERCAERGEGYSRCHIDPYNQKLVMCQVHEPEAEHAAKSVNSFLRCNGDQTGEPDWMKDDASGWRPSGRMSIGFRRMIQ